MIPYILAAVGGYLIGDSLKGKQFAEGGMMAKGGRVMPFLKFEYATEARKKLDKGQLPVFDGGIGFDYLEKEKKLYYLPSVTGDWKEVGEFKSKKEAIDWLSEQLKMESFADGGSIKVGYYSDPTGKKYFTYNEKTGERSGTFKTKKEAEDSLKGKQFAEGGMMDIKIKLFDIDYDTEDEDVRTIKSLKKNNLLPQVIETTAEKMGWDGDNLEEFIEYRGADFISDETGFLVNSFNFEISK